MQNITDTYVLELIIRGAAAGILSLLAVYLLTTKPVSHLSLKGALFAIGSFAYVLVSSPANTVFPEPVVAILAALATVNSVLFWWFATALFDDSTRWRLYQAVPFLIMCSLFVARLYSTGWMLGFYDDFLQQTLIFGMMGHAIWLAIVHRQDDLIEFRRKFRTIFAAIIGLTGCGIAIGELIFLDSIPPVWLSSGHALLLLCLALWFGLWIIRSKELFSGGANPSPISFQKNPELAVSRERLHNVMTGGAYQEEGLTIAMLADRVQLPEYKLRRLINGNLGYRNFPTFLNSYRIEHAKTILSDPERARQQVLQIALEVGYASITPFNRAFREAEGMSPVAYRQQQLTGGDASSGTPD